ncbi:hypothetical protein GWK08_03750 [Leptobacterium flavescens]|uniref:histidine kinase n=1 Tax=Leptobacterium flavescens TaxID=472055 RepID=A0A6P0UJ23_9FLAO|nr:HAMP domain-containing sensor histidine kinase [Leptobacterium flavescens]NER12542.1 hypothetical protein [Leptobacterium flavescens]
MKNRNRYLIINFIIVTIVATIAIQVYWNIKNYEINKQQLINEVQTALDNGVEIYYADLAKTDIIAFVDTERDNDSTYTVDRAKRFIGRVIKSPEFFSLDSISVGTKADTIFVDPGDTLQFTQRFDLNDSNHVHASEISPQRITGLSVFRGQQRVDSINRSTIRSLANKIIISVTRDSIAFNALTKAINSELKRKDIDLNYALGHYKRDSTIIDSFNNVNDAKFKLYAFSKSTYLPRGEQLKIAFSNLSLIALKRGLTGILLSFLLSASIIACMLYLLRVINRQKQLAEIKNDLISNITHEFKTPITTVSTALEGIENFNSENDKEKTKKYLSISNQQLKKLHLMVEKLLETATLDSDKLLLNKEPLDIVDMLQSLTDKHRMISPEKYLSFKSNIETHIIQADHFHLENAVSNLIDNAVKYGGESIDINLNSVLDSVEITIADNGEGIDKNHREKIFDKFYRIPTGNRHDVKGFGIGLYYTRKIVEKHGGAIQLVPDTKYTIFKIRLYNGAKH